ncbi:hypothetical protein QTO34_010981 [Cnephaeus nilssonii]|uniref:Uncharacterized protein n=1 Tax=Cnephaeus nilssonii TaxID=3371016 RepID=A0AA40HDF7_CNENI|nr:hypothetical protein QTO34_010981 [Eptesicus nilssonii]
MGLAKQILSLIQHGLDVGQHAALRDGHLAQQLVELLVVADGQLQVARDDARLLVVAAALPASSRISAVRYSSTAARYTGAPAPTRSARCTRPTGNCSPAREDRVLALARALPPCFRVRTWFLEEMISDGTGLTPVFKAGPDPDAASPTLVKRHRQGS